MALLSAAVIAMSTLFAAADDMDGLALGTVQAAEEAGVSLQDLIGAMGSTGLPARAYLAMTGELAPARPAAALKPPLGAAVGRAECIINKESGGADVPNRQGSGAQGPGQYFGATWSRHSALYRQATGWTGPLSLHSYTDVLAVMSYMLSAMPSTRREWAVGGC